MKRWFVLLLFVFLCLVGAVACASELPPEASRLFAEDSRWDGYDIVATSGYGGNEWFAAEYAVLLKKGNENVLCIVEREPDADVFSLTAESSSAVYQGDQLPSILMDSAGGVVFYTYHHDDGSGFSAEMYSTAKQNGEWRMQGTILTGPDRAEDGLHAETSVWIDRRVLHLDTDWYDAEGNQRASGDHSEINGVDIATSLNMFDISTLPHTAGDAQVRFGGMPYAETELLAMEMPIGADVSPVNIVLRGVLQENGMAMIDQASIYRGTELLQVFPIGILGWYETGGSVRFEDANFDGYTDILICRSASSYNAYYDYWLWSPPGGLFEPSSLYSSLEAWPFFDAQTRTISCMAKDGAAQHEEYVYGVDNEGVPYLVAHDTIRYGEDGNRIQTDEQGNKADP